MIRRDVYRFGDFTLVPGERRLSAGTTVIRLTPKAFDLLAALVRHAGRLMTKHELLARVWPEVFVDEGILTVHVSALHKALTTLPPRVRRCSGQTDPPSCTNSWVAADTIYCQARTTNCQAP